MDYRIDFYQLVLTPTADIATPAVGFEGIINGTFDAVYSRHGYSREVWNLTFRAGPPRSFGGQLRKFRTADLPEIGALGEEAQELQLEPGQGLIEPNFFVYYPRHHVVGWHVNGHASHPSRFAEVLSNIWRTEVALEPLIQPDAILRLMRGEAEVKSIQVTVPRPSNPALFPNDNFSPELLGMMNNANADSLKLEMGVDLRRGPDRRMNNGIKRTLQNLLGIGATTAKADVVEDGLSHTIDLIADRVCSWQSANTNGRFLPSQSMFELIDEAYEECRDSINGYFRSLDAANH